ncbi:MAG: ABC transporter ATP-binding protein [Candidatus Vecturithrix sp.]|jgi:iron(III) transport system ATP-binding protein|nr:ABC transporter ATP-binding protein [Candidatus Vecturithrix sp.]
MKAVNIQLQHISKTFIHKVKGEVAAVNDVNLEIKPGELLTLLGPSGCGKTTTLRMVAGFEIPDTGRIYLGNEDVTDLMANRRDIGFVFQNYALFPHLSVFENVAYGLKVKEMTKAEIVPTVSDVLKLVGLEGYEHQFPNQLSGGEQQRVALARAIVIKPKVLLFDEPLSNLDAKLRVYTRSEIRRLQKALHITSLYVTHDQEEAMAISDRIVVMNHGAIEQIGTAEELYFAPETEFVAKFIGRINTLPAHVTSFENEMVSLNIFDHTYQLQDSSAPVHPATELNVFIRPEFIKLHQPNQGHFRGVIRERTFLGEKVEYVVDIQGQQINVTSYDPLEHETFALNQEVGIQLDARNIKILRDYE